MSRTQSLQRLKCNHLNVTNNTIISQTHESSKCHERNESSWYLVRVHGLLQRCFASSCEGHDVGPALQQRYASICPALSTCVCVRVRERTRGGEREREKGKERRRTRERKREGKRDGEKEREREKE